MLPLLTSEQITECIAFENLNPQGQHRADLRAAVLAWTVMRTAFNGNPKAKLEKFMFKFFKEPKTPEQMALLLRGIAAQQSQQPQPAKPKPKPKAKSKPNE